jgi:HlyD family secretion protein
VTQIRKAPQVVQNVVTYTVVLGVDNDDYALFPGMTVVTKIVTDMLPASLSVPLAALRFKPRAEVIAAVGAQAPAGSQAPAGPVVSVMRNGTMTPVRVVTGVDDGQRIAVKSADLQSGDRVIVAEQDASAILPTALPDGGL